jgi:hypothetical protein
MNKKHMWGVVGFVAGTIFGGTVLRLVGRILGRAS